ncbi:hypothetical protein ACPEF3_08015, partial [Klebsiella sp. K822]|uniref:hypothetical protein n=1 Tax=Klebsiella sp. K822 TaxID=3369405 RepID=UPI003C2C1E71
FSHLSICGFLWITDHVGAFDGQHAGEIIREREKLRREKEGKTKMAKKYQHKKPRRGYFFTNFGWPD